MAYESFMASKDPLVHNIILSGILNKGRNYFKIENWLPQDIDVIEGLRAAGTLEAKLNDSEVTKRLLTESNAPNAEVLPEIIELRTALINNDSVLSLSLRTAHREAINHAQQNSNSIWTKPAPRIGAALTILGGTSLAALLLVVQFAHVIPPFALALYILAAAVALIGLATLGISAAVHCYGASKTSYLKV